MDALEAGKKRDITANARIVHRQKTTSGIKPRSIPHWPGTPPASIVDSNLARQVSWLVARITPSGHLPGHRHETPSGFIALISNHLQLRGQRRPDPLSLNIIRVWAHRLPL